MHRVLTMCNLIVSEVFFLNSRTTLIEFKVTIQINQELTKIFFNHWIVIQKKSFGIGKKTA